MVCKEKCCKKILDFIEGKILQKLFRLVKNVASVEWRIRKNDETLFHRPSIQYT